MDSAGTLHNALGTAPDSHVQPLSRVPGLGMLRGTRRGLELVFGGCPFEESLNQLERRLTEQPEFYRGSSAIALFEELPQIEEFAALQVLLKFHGIRAQGVSGPPGCETLARAAGIEYVGETHELLTPPAKGRRRLREHGLPLSEAARSLIADFEGARKDRAGRPTSGKLRSFPAQAPAAPVDIKTGTLYHNGTLRGGQAMHHVGNIVIVGDVNPGAEVVASGDIVIFGALRGVAHAGAQGDGSARVFALELAPTQLRIATAIAADFEVLRGRKKVAECALFTDGRICVVPHDRAAARPKEALH
ncbi:MAG: septum site-determining protein MinC [Candidatus Eremiobacteraeota bacterium]|nr:septum site-determining protein MinC [Candidatus Eremiobacteraeota bacterium]